MNRILVRITRITATSFLLSALACDGDSKTTRTGEQGSPAQPGEMPGETAETKHQSATERPGAQGDRHMVGDGQPGSNDKPAEPPAQLGAPGRAADTTAQPLDADRTKAPPTP